MLYFETLYLKKISKYLCWRSNYCFWQIEKCSNLFIIFTKQVSNNAIKDLEARYAIKWCLFSNMLTICFPLLSVSRFPQLCLAFSPFIYNVIFIYRFYGFLNQYYVFFLLNCIFSTMQCLLTLFKRFNCCLQIIWEHFIFRLD